MICDVHWFDQLPFLTQRHCDQCCDLNSEDVRMTYIDISHLISELRGPLLRVQ